MKHTLLVIPFCSLIYQWKKGENAAELMGNFPQFQHILITRFRVFQPMTEKGVEVLWTSNALMKTQLNSLSIIVILRTAVIAVKKYGITEQKGKNFSGM